MLGARSRGGGAKMPFILPSMLPLLSSLLVYVFSSILDALWHRATIALAPSCGMEPRISHDGLSVRALTPGNHFSRHLERHKQPEPLPRPACAVTSLDVA